MRDLNFVCLPRDPDGPGQPWDEAGSLERTSLADCVAIAHLLIERGTAQGMSIWPAFGLMVAPYCSRSAFLGRDSRRRPLGTGGSSGPQPARGLRTAAPPRMVALRVTGRRIVPLRGPSRPDRPVQRRSSGGECQGQACFMTVYGATTTDDQPWRCWPSQGPASATMTLNGIPRLMSRVRVPSQSGPTSGRLVSERVPLDLAAAGVGAPRSPTRPTMAVSCAYSTPHPGWVALRRDRPRDPADTVH